MTTSASLPYDKVLVDIADYVCGGQVFGAAALDIARHSLMDSLGCAVEALHYPECRRLLGPAIGGTEVPQGSRVPGTSYRLETATAAFNISALTRWTDYNDTWVAAQTTHPSDDMGPVLAVADHLSQVRRSRGEAPLTMRAVLDGMIMAHEIQGVLGMGTSISRHGIDHVLFVRVAVAPVIARMLGGSRDAVLAATSLAFLDSSLCVHRFGTNTGPRKGWAAADATAQAVRFASMAVRGEPGYPQVLTHEKWGFNRWMLGGEALVAGGPYGSMVMENIFFKILGPVVIHAQSQIEVARALHHKVRGRWNDIERIDIETHVRTMETIDKKGPLRNAADRDHCLQYAVAVMLLNGELKPSDYEDETAANPEIDRLRGLMQVRENPEFTRRFLDPAERANPAAIEIRFRDGSTTGRVEVIFPVGQVQRRADGLPLLVRKFEKHLATVFEARRAQQILELCLDHERLLATPVDGFMELVAMTD